MLGVYVHLPFCPYICPYCDFAKWPLRATAAARYLDALYAEIEREPPAAAATMYLGGGTPNAYDAPAVADLLARLRGRFPGAREVSIELNPELVRENDLAALSRCRDHARLDRRAIVRPRPRSSASDANTVPNKSPAS